ncbi:hypothetical protein Droror1_Dr00005143 [Drosera rotundifolia]
MKGWSGVSKLGVVETIFEEEEEVSEEEEERVVEKCCESDDDNLLSSPLLSPPLSPISCPSSPDLESIVDSWSLARRRRADVKIHVQDRCFHLHKDVLSSKSAYLRRHLPEVTSLTLAPSLNLTSDTFSQIAEFCYTLRLTLTPFNLAVLRTAAETLEMHTSDYVPASESLGHRTESYFSRSVSTNRDFANIVFKSCLKLLPEAEERACLASRCLEVICEGEDGAGEEIKAVRPEEFTVIVESMGRRFTGSHDFLYEVIDLYLKVYDGKMSEDQKTHICNTIDCNMVSPELLMRAVQNPRMPLRFVVQAMLTEQLNTHRSICITGAAATRSIANHSSSRVERPPNHRKVPTLGAILQQDAANRQVTQLKAAVNTTMSRIHCLEKELSTMKKRLIESERHRGVADGGRSASFRFGNESSANKIERGERGSISSDNLRFRVNTVGSTAGRLGSNAETPQLKKSHLGQRLIRGLKSVFRASKDSKVGGSSKEGEDYVYDEDDDVFKEGQLCSTTEMGLAEIVHSHNRTRSIS